MKFWNSLSAILHSFCCSIVLKIFFVNFNIYLQGGHLKFFLKSWNLKCRKKSKWTNVFLYTSRPCSKRNRYRVLFHLNAPFTYIFQKFAKSKSQILKKLLLNKKRNSFYYFNIFVGCHYWPTRGYLLFKLRKHIFQNVFWMEEKVSIIAWSSFSEFWNQKKF